MSEQGKEDEQLLQDASTLLMFANVAAKQLHGHGPPAQQPPSFPQKPNLPHIKDLMNPAGPQHPPYQPTGPIYPSGPLRLPPLVGSMPSRPAATSQVPSQIPQLATHYNSPQGPHSRISGVSNMGQPPAHQNSHHHPHSHAQPSSGPMQHPDKERPARLPYANIEPKPPLLPSVQFQRYSEGQHLPAVSRKSPSPLASVGPIRSPGSSQSPAVAKSPGKSPGPASVALARGINLASGERNSDNAHLAAAALAAAADMPFPLRRDSVKKEASEELPPQTRLKPALETEEDSERTEDELSRALVPPKVSTEPEKSNVAPPGKSLFTFTVPPLEEYRVDPDAGVIGCICGLEDDDGFTVQCDICFRWQHCICMGFYSSDEIPEDEYKCYFCDKSKWGKMDPATCREETIRRLEAEQDDENVKDSDKPKRKQSSDSADTSKRRKTEKGKVEVLKSADKRKQSRENSSSSVNIVKPDPKPVFVSEGNDQVYDGNAEPYQSVYYKLKANDFKTPHIKELLSSYGKNLSENLHADSPRIVSLQEFKNLKLARILRTKNNREPPGEAPEYVVQVKSYSENAKQKFNGITRMGLYISHSELMMEDEDGNSTDATESSDAKSIEIPEGTPVIEYLGEIDKFENYKKDLVNQYALWGSPKPNVIRVKIQNDSESPLDLVLDARFVGNEARFIRKSCPTTSNCKVVSTYVKDTNTFRFLVVTTKALQLNLESPDEELRLDWEWDETHPIRKMYGDSGVKFDQFSDVEKSVLISGVDNILNFVECGCSSSLASEHHNVNNDCAIFKVKKATSYLLRSTRKASGISNVNFTKAKDELIPRQPREFVSWEQKLIEREKGIRMELRITTKDGSLTAEDALVPKDNGDSITDNQNEDNVSELSYKQQLMRKARTAPKLAEGKRSKTDVEKVDISQLPIPVSQNLKTKVSDTINKKTEMAEIPSARPLPAAKLEIISEVPLANKPEEKITPTPLAEEAPKAVQEERPAPKVKKLSFADYKKKMK